VLTTLDLAEMVRFHDAHGGEASIHLCRVDDPSAFGVVPTRPDGEVIAFVEKPPRAKAPSHWINAGTYVLEPSVIDRIPPRLTVSIERETFPRMLDRRGRLFALQSDGYWIDIGTPRKYIEANADVIDGALGTPPARGAIEVAPGVWRQGDVSIATGARVEPPVLLGEGSTVAAGARLGQVVLGPGCEVARRGCALRSVMLDGARLEADALALDTVVGPQAVVGQEAAVRDYTIVGASSTVAAGTRLSGARVPARVPSSP
jgi:mannose-1-phosphate guanylyltransferase